MNLIDIIFLVLFLAIISMILFRMLKKQSSSNCISKCGGCSFSRMCGRKNLK